MFGRIFLGIVAIISLLWLGYATYDRVNNDIQYTVEYLFNDEDGAVLIVHQPDQLESLIADFKLNASNKVGAVLQTLATDKIASVAISQNRNQLLIQTKKEITPTSVSTLFNNASSLKINQKKLEILGLKGSFQNNFIYLATEDYEHNASDWSAVQYDKNAAGSFINLSGNQYAVTDIYLKNGGIVEYKFQAKKTINATKVNDQVVFANVVPTSSTIYEFYETDYLRHKFPEIMKNPINNWLRYGLVKVKVNGNEAVITDYIDGQDPIQVLYDFYKKESKVADNDYFANAQLPNVLNAKGLYVYRFDDYVVLANNRAICETIIGDYKLGKTISQNPQKLSDVYNQLPQKVNYRKVDTTTKFATSVYKNVLLTTVVRGEVTLNATEKETTDSSNSFVVGGVASDIQFIHENAFFVTTKENKVIFFDNGKKIWEQTVDGELVGNGTLIDLYANQKNQLLVATNKKIYVFDINGAQPNGFPINLDDQTLIQQPVLYRWKGNGVFIAPLTGGRIGQFDNQGRELAIIRTKLNEITAPPIVWVSANKPFIGVTDGVQFEMIQADIRKSYRVFATNEAKLLLKLPNEIKLFGILKNQLVAYNQKGGVSYFEQFSNGTLLPTLQPELGIVVKDGQTIKLFNSNGVQWGAIPLSFSDVADVQIFNTTNGATFIAVVDGLENKVHLYKSNGALFKEQPLEGSKMVRYYNGHLFTVIDNLIVKYPL
ncbi:MAG TPA: hypothetical protein PKN22_02530 [Taishania sp.]|nr:hypothetical protein [Taishania sp.]HNS41609.1 hypothetical protein [Taishania sp.]